MAFLRLLVLLVLVSLAGASATVRAQPLVLRAEPNQTVYLRGDTLRVKLLAESAQPQQQLDLYVGIVFPDRRSTLFFSSLAPPAWQPADLEGNPATFARLGTNVSLPAGTTALPDILTIDIPHTVALGTYELLFAAARASALIDGSVDGNDLLATTRVPLMAVAPPAPHVPAAYSYTPYRPLLEQRVADGSLYVTGPAQVRSEALAEARRQLDTLLRYRPDIITRLRAARALIGVFPDGADVCSLPYYADLAGQPLCARAPGGLGGVPGRPASSCSERNLLRLPGDEYWRGFASGENVCVHEMAHLIMNVGLTLAERARIEAEFARAKAANLWGNDFIMTDSAEYFAELTQSYFCANPELPVPATHEQGVNCPFDLAAFDPQSFALMHSIYGASSDLR